MQHADRPGGVPAGFDLAAIGIENAHAKVGTLGRFDDDELIAANAGMSIGQRGGQSRRHRRQRLNARIQHDEIVAQPVHLGESGPHPRDLCTVAGYVQCP